MLAKLYRVQGDVYLKMLYINEIKEINIHLESIFRFTLLYGKYYPDDDFGLR